MTIPLCTLTIDLNAIAENYRRICARVGAVSVAAVVKADAYGLGAAQVIPVLERAGCPLFYVASLDEGIAARAYTDRPIAILSGPAGISDIAFYQMHGLTPVLGSLDQMAWIAAAAPALGVMIHIDTGMNRLGLTQGDVQVLLEDPSLLQALTVERFLSHFACADEKDHPLNAQQSARFAALLQDLRAAYGRDIPASFCNSSAVFHCPLDYYDEVRVGAALYGINPVPEESVNPMGTAVTLTARILQIKTARAGETVGYGASDVLEADTKLAVLGLGYADGVLRAAGPNLALYWHGYPCRVRGRISMDLIVVEIPLLTAPVRAPDIGDDLILLGPSQGVDIVAQAAGTIGYEILTSLSRRARRVYLPLPA